jgi:nitrate reductase NapE component
MTFPEDTSRVKFQEDKIQFRLFVILSVALLPLLQVCLVMKYALSIPLTQVLSRKAEQVTGSKASARY